MHDRWVWLVLAAARFCRRAGSKKEVNGEREEEERKRGRERQRREEEREVAKS